MNNKEEICATIYKKSTKKHTKPLKKITNTAELKTVLEELQNQWFWFFSTYELEEKKIDHIIRDANKLGIEYNKQELKKKYYEGDFVCFQEAMEVHFWSFSLEDKLVELAGKHRPKTLEDWDHTKRKQRTRKRSTKQITIKAYFKRERANEILELLGYVEGQKIPHTRSERSKTPYKRDDNRNQVFVDSWTLTNKEGEVIGWNTYKNGNIKFSRNIQEINRLYTIVWNNNKTRAEKNENDCIYIIQD